MSRFTEEFKTETFYHIYNRGNNGENIFYKSKNYKYFLKKYINYISPFVDTYSFSLLPSYFNFIIRTKPECKDLPEQFRKFFISYSQAINKQESRIGSLFMKPFRRREISEYNYLKRLIFYLHNNPVELGLSNVFERYEWSSYRIILSEAKTNLKRDEVIRLFNSKEEFIEFHNAMRNGKVQRCHPFQLLPVLKLLP